MRYVLSSSAINPQKRETIQNARLICLVTGNDAGAVKSNEYEEEYTGEDTYPSSFLQPSFVKGG